MKTEHKFVVQKFEKNEWIDYDEFETEEAAKNHHYNKLIKTRACLT